MIDQTLMQQLSKRITIWAREFGFQQVGITIADVSSEKEHLQRWLDHGYHGSMAWMEEHQSLRENPDLLVEGTTRVLSFRMDYLPENTEQIKILKSSDKAYISRYSMGRDYHKLIRKRLAKIGQLITNFCQEHKIDVPQQRAFVDSAPVLERPLAQQAGLGWVGKHTLLINPHAGSWFFLGEIYTNIPLETNNDRVENQCGDCSACLQVCPTDAFPKPYVLDARRCISYLTIENDDVIPIEFREVMGNRVFGCDDCQAICPWNKYAKFTQEKDFLPRHSLDNSDLLALFKWNEQEFLDRTAGSPIRRIGYRNWLRNLSVGLGNGPKSEDIINSLTKTKTQWEDPVLSEHLDWAIHEQRQPIRRRKRKIKRP